MEIVKLIAAWWQGAPFVEREQLLAALGGEVTEDCLWIVDPYAGAVHIPTGTDNPDRENDPDVIGA